MRLTVAVDAVSTSRAGEMRAHSLGKYMGRQV
jgi:hypothetical protein